MRSRTESPCLHQAVVEIRGIPFCEACAREQQAYFAIGELTRGKHSLPSKPLAEVLEDGIHITMVEPGAVATELTDHITDEEVREGLKQRSI